MDTTVFLIGDKLGPLIIESLNNLKTIDGIEHKSASSGNSETSESNDLSFMVLSSSDELKQIFDALNPQKTTVAASKTIPNLSSNLTISYTGIQRHLLKNNIQSNHPTQYLSDILGNTKVTEPAIRDSELFIFDMNVLRASETNHADYSNPSGIFSEEATQMFRYAGMSETNKHVIILNATESQTKLLSQFVWYYSEAAAARFPDHPYFKDTVHEYVVNMPSMNSSISFFKSKASGRWWVKAPGTEENRWKACSYEDYADACQDEISSLVLGMLTNVE